MALFSANVDAALSQRREEAYEDVAFRLSPALGLMNHKDSKGGNAIKVTVKNGYSAGVGGTYTTALTNVGETQRQAFLVTPSVLYALETVDNTSELFSQGDDNAVIEIMSDAEKSCMSSAALQVDQALFSDGYGTQFTILSNTGSGPYVLTATNPTDLFKIQTNQVLASKATPAAASLDTGTATVTNVNAIAGTVTVTANSGWTPTNTHVVGLSGTMLASATISTFPGFKAWLTNDSTALAAAFFGVTRNVDPVGLAGHVIDLSATGTDIITATNTVIQSISNFGKANPSLVFMNSTNYQKAMNLLDNRMRLTQSKGENIEVLYDGFSFVGPAGKPVTVHVASACSPQDVFVLDPDTWHFASPGNKFIRPGQPDGSSFIPADFKNLDALLCKMRANGFIYCDAPGFNGRAIVAG